MREGEGEVVNAIRATGIGRSGGGGGRGCGVYNGTGNHLPR